jgi:hypothetical protein
MYLAFCVVAGLAAPATAWPPSPSGCSRACPPQAPLGEAYRSHGGPCSPGERRDLRQPPLRVGGGALSKRYLAAVAPRPRVLAFGSAAALVVAGSICATLVGGLTGEVLAIALITLGLGAAVLLMFLEVGLSEERELAREEKRRRQRAADGQRRLRRRRWPRRPG